MRLSMWILADWLEVYHPTCNIQEGKRTLRNARLYSEGLQMERSTVYVGSADGFIDGVRDKVLCANEHDLMLLDSSDVNEILNKILDAFDYYNSWSDQLNENIKTDYSLDDLLRDSEPVFNRMLCLADASYYVYAQTGFEKRAETNPDTKSVLTDHIMTLDSIMAINEDKRIRLYNPHTYLLDVKTGIRCAVRNLFFRGQHRGWLITDKERGDYTRGETDVQDELGDMVERWIEYHQNQKELVEKSGVLLQILEGICIRGEEGYRRVESLNWRRGDELYVYVIRFGAGGESPAYLLDRKLEKLGAVFSVHHEGNLILVQNASLTDTGAFRTELLQLLERASCYCGKSPVFNDVFELKTNYELAAVAADFGENRSDRLREIESAALPYYFSLIEKYDRAGVTHPVLQTLLAYDDKHNTQLFQTLKIYLQCERNYILTAKALHLHRNSLIYRVQRIIDLTAVDLDSFKTRLHLLMAIELERGNQ